MLKKQRGMLFQKKKLTISILGLQGRQSQLQHLLLDDVALRPRRQLPQAHQLLQLLRGDLHHLGGGPLDHLLVVDGGGGQGRGGEEEEEEEEGGDKGVHGEFC